MIRRTLPQRRASETFDLRFWSQNFTITVGRYPDGTIGEVFIDGGKTGQDIQSTARDAAVVLSLALQHGVPIETIRHAVTRNGSGEAASILGATVDRLATVSVKARRIEHDRGPHTREPRSNTTRRTSGRCSKRSPKPSSRRRG